MNSIFLWIISTLLDSIWLSFRKRALNEWNLSNTMFRLIGHFFWFFIILLLFYIVWIDKQLFWNTKYLFIIFFISLLISLNSYFNTFLMKEIKLSELLPYDNLDKIFIIIIWFFLFYWTDKWSSIITLIITLITISIIIYFSIDIKKLKIPKKIWLYILLKISKAISIILIWYVLFKYSTITFMVSNWFIETIFFIIIIIITKDNIKSLIEQKKIFYKNRLYASISGRSSSIIWLIIIQQSWVIIATLLWFSAIVFNIISMKIILNDKPNKKQIIMAFLVISLIWVWYYYK